MSNEMGNIPEVYWLASWENEHISISPGQEPVDKMLLLLQIARPVPLDVAVQLLLQRVAGVLGVKLGNLKINAHANVNDPQKWKNVGAE